MAPLKTLRRVIRATVPRFHRMLLSTSPSPSPSRTSKPPHPGIIDSDQHGDETLFAYTSGRWLWDEAAQLRKRYQPFNIEALKQAAARSVNAEVCVKLTKLPEGSYNKAFLLTMDNDVQVIAKIPNPYIPQKFVTASEVATLEFLRNELGIPVPRVFAWSSKKDQPVGVEYIIMEKAAGNELGKSWPTMDISAKVDIVSQLAKIQAKIAAVDFGCHGSLFYRDDIEGGIDEEERRFMSAYRGPWSSSGAYAIDIARREKEWIARIATPRHPADPLRQSDSQESPDCHLKLLDRYLEVVPHLIPSDPGLNRSVLWHSDLHFGNIFVRGNQVVSIIDWQGCSSLPVFHACRIPKFLKVHEPLLFDLPPATGLTPQEKADNLQRYQLTQLQRLYITKFRETDDDVFSALSFPQALTRQQLIDFSGYTWEDDGLFLFREMMLRTWREWMELTGQPQSTCPVTFSADELASHVAEGKSWEDRRELFGALGVPLDGWVHPEDFEAKVETMRSLVSSVIDATDDKDGVKDALRAWKLSESGPGSLSGNLMDIWRAKSTNPQTFQLLPMALNLEKRSFPDHVNPEKGVREIHSEFQHTQSKDETLCR
ncbi:phosphotransferase enzyme family protein [Aspergillus indologenus CBS 114.80]|uniref:Phosphotransferase enzyme family protein n=1 Tax=Aspergillus indologenus CBS 114.80 TaxID=1450541 RepID=A0A2V5J1N6_9EURO|nr:phosphotransferase enzyme family protein [Aspergillus indologenus CBS 114.80]